MSQTRAQLLKGFSNTSAPADALTVDSSGNVGIGASSPVRNLHLATSGINNVYFHLTHDGTGHTDADGADLRLNRSTDTLDIMNLENAAITFHTNGENERMRILPAGGLTFNGDTSAANALDDYEEGTWTPTINFDLAFTGGVYVVNEGFYTKIGRLVNVSCELAISSKGSSTGQVNIAGLPFTPNSDDESRASGVVGYHQDVTGIDMPIQILIEPNQTSFPLRDSGSSSSTGISDSNLGNGFRFYFTITYMT